MAGYAVVALIHGVDVRARDATRDAAVRGPEPDPTATVLDLTPPERSAVFGGIRDRLAGVRDQFGQLTWYLVNPEGWR
jgi:hypothetical protein